MSHHLRFATSGQFLVGFGVFLITAFVLLKLTAMFGPAVVSGYVGYPESGVLERTSAVFPVWLEWVASRWNVAYSTAGYIYASSAAICVLWAIVAILLLIRARYALVGLIGVMVVALLQPIVGGLWVRNELRFDYDTLVLCGVLAVIFTRRKVRVLFAHEHG